MKIEEEVKVAKEEREFNLEEDDTPRECLTL